MLQTEQINELLKRVDSLPPAPQILPQLLSALTGAETDLSRVIDLISFDPALTAKLLQTCNSAFFSRSGPVNDVFEAVSRLGFHCVYRIVAMVTGAQCLRPSRPSCLDAGRLWRHSVTTAFAAQFVAEDVEADSGMLFTAGMLHDIGKVVLAGASPATASRQAGAEQAGAQYGVSHAEIGARLLELWKFSPLMAASVRFHHDPWAAGASAPEAACVALANGLAHGLDDNSIGQPTGGMEPEAAVKILELAPEALTRYQNRLKENLEFVEAMCRVQG